MNYIKLYPSQEVHGILYIQMQVKLIQSYFDYYYNNEVKKYNFYFGGGRNFIIRISFQISGAIY